MTRRWTAFLLALAALAAVWPAEAMEAGAAKVEITPPVGSPMNGYGFRFGRGAVDVHDPIWARCLYLNDGETAVFLVTADLCMISRELRQRVLELAPRTVPRENIILAATHTHNAQGGIIHDLPFRIVSGRYDPEVLALTAEGFAEAMRLAYENRRRAVVGYGMGEQVPAALLEGTKASKGEAAAEGEGGTPPSLRFAALSANRRIQDGPIDPQIGVIRVEDADGSPIAIVANLAAHPTTIPDEHGYSLSAEYPGFYYTALEDQAGADCVALFMNGAEGNQRCTNPEGKAGWERTESLGRLLAKYVAAIAGTITCREAKLQVTSATADLPPSIMGTIAPATAFLQTLEIDDLLVTFLPGEPCVEIGLGLRERALARGYKAQFTVGLANDYLGYFVPPEYYGELFYETSANFYGPFISEWFWTQYGKLMTHPGAAGIEASASLPGGAPEVRTEAGLTHIVLEGPAADIGFQQGTVFRDAVERKYTDSIFAPVDSGDILPDAWYWQKLSPYFNMTKFGLPYLAMGARRLLNGMPNDLLKEIDGMATATGLPFDAVWMAQCTPSFATRPDMKDYYASALCTMFVAIGDRAGADDLLVARNLDWAEEEALAVCDVRPEEGHRFLHVAFPWTTGVFTGINDAGLTLCVQRVKELGDPAVQGAPVEFMLRQILQTYDAYDEAVAAVEAATHLKGYHVLVASPKGPCAGVVELGAEPVVRRAEGGLLLGADPESEQVDAAARLRYARIAELLGDEHIIAASEMQEALHDAQAGQLDAARIWNGETRYSVIVEPNELALHVSARGEDGTPGEWVKFSLEGGAE